MKGWSTRDLKALCPCVRERVHAVMELFLHRTATHLQVIETARDLERQRHYVDIGVSKPGSLIAGPHRGKHLTRDGLVPQVIEAARVLACDMAPQRYLSLPHWNPEGHFWGVYGELALARGLLWGGDWDDTPGRRPFNGWDFPHVYLQQCQCKERE